MKKFIVMVLVIHFALVGCAHQPETDSDAMNRPFMFETTAEFYRDLQSLEKELNAKDYQLLTDAIGNLQAHDLENVSYEDFHASMSGLSPNQIIEKAEQVCRRVNCLR